MYNISIPNMLNGVSQQPPTVRFPSQCSVLENAYASPTESLTKRYPTEFVSDWAPPSTVHGKLHIIDRGDGEEAYAVSLSQELIRAFDLKTGAEVPIQTPSGLSYLASGDPEKIETDLSLTTMADVTFVCNRNVTVTLDTNTEAADKPQGLLWIKTGNYGTKYAVEVKLLRADGTIRDSLSASYTTPKVVDAGDGYTAVEESLQGETFAVGTAVIDTSYIAGKLMKALEDRKTELIGTGVTEWNNLSFTRQGYAIHVQLNDTIAATLGWNFDILNQDGIGGNGLQFVKDSTQVFEDLPIIAKNGMLVRIDGLPSEQSDDYYVRFLANSPETGSGMSEGVWEESAPKGLPKKFTATTMPHGLIRKFYLAGDTIPSGYSVGDPYFVFTPLNGTAAANDLEWSERLVGDDFTNPEPSFSGQQITSIFGFQGRLGILTGEAVVLSEAGNFFNFWRTATASLLDSDPIDVYSAYPQVTLFRYGIPFGNRLVLFSDKAQMSLSAPETILTPRSVILEPVSRYECVSDCMPALVGEEIFFAFPRGAAFTGIRDMVANVQDSAILTAPEITAHVPKYIEGSPVQMQASPFDRTLILRTDRDPSALYIYKWFDSGNERVQSSWSRWTFNGVRVLSVGWYLSRLYFLIFDGVKIGLRVMDIRENRTDPGSQICVRLDNRRLILENSVTDGTFQISGFFGTGDTPLPPPEVDNVDRILFSNNYEVQSSVLTDSGLVVNPGELNVPLAATFGLVEDTQTISSTRWVSTPYVRMAGGSRVSGSLLYNLTIPGGGVGRFFAGNWSNTTGLKCLLYIDGVAVEAFEMKASSVITDVGTAYTIVGNRSFQISGLGEVLIQWSFSASDQTSQFLDQWGGSWSATVSGASSSPRSVSLRFEKFRPVQVSGQATYRLGPTTNLFYTNTGSSPIQIYAGQAPSDVPLSPEISLVYADGVNAGAEVPIILASYSTATGLTTFTIPENVGSPRMYLGYRYNMRYRFSPVYLRTGQDRTALTAGRFQIRNIQLVYDESGPFRAEVSSINPLVSDSYSYTRGSVVSSSFVNSPIESGTMKIPVMSKPDQVHVDLINDTPYPSRFVSAEVEASYDGRFRRI